MNNTNEAVLRDALEFAASTIELFDDATMRSGYRLDSTDCAEIIRALIESPRIRALAATATVAKDGEEVRFRPIRYTSDGALKECPCCCSLDVGGAHHTVHCQECGLTVTAPGPLQNAMDKWNLRPSPVYATPKPEASDMQRYAQQCIEARNQQSDAVDAARYRWLRESGEIVAGNRPGCIAIPMYSPSTAHKEALDRAIDAAIEQRKADKKGDAA